MKTNKLIDNDSEEMLRILTKYLSNLEIDEIMERYEESPEHLFAWMKFTRPKDGWESEEKMATWVLSCVRKVSKTKGTQ